MFFFFNDPATTEIYTLSLPDALPIFPMSVLVGDTNGDRSVNAGDALQTRNRSGQPAASSTFRSDVNTDGNVNSGDALRSEEHTSELQSRQYLVCRLLLEKKTLSRTGT